MRFLRKTVFFMCMSVACQASIGFASDANDKPKQLPPDAFVITTFREHEIGYPKTNAISNCQNMLNKLKEKSRGREIQIDNSHIFDTNFECRAVYYQWTLDIAKSDTSVFTFYNEATRYLDMTVTAYCAPRSLQQKQILSLARFCEKEPNQKCFDKTYLDYLSTLQETIYYELSDQPSCRM